jgi:ATP-dependent exoDNAse (exonuclease V) beta subunit
MTWFEFLLRDGVKPYQTYKTDIGRVRSINFISEKPRFIERTDFERYYLDAASNVYSDAVADLACVLDDSSKGNVIRRIEAIYDMVLVDEMQDLAGYDLEFLKLMLKSKIMIVMVGDPRQAVYRTNRSNKNKQYRGRRLMKWIGTCEREGLCAQRTFDVNHRSNAVVCAFADGIYPSLPSTRSGQREVVEHEGVVLVHTDDVERYIEQYHPQELRWDRGNKQAGPSARNFGEVKGLTFERVLIYPTTPITAFIEEGTELVEVSAAKLYVAVTRARHSVGIVTQSRSSKSPLPLWSGR